jgi:hypothetical protein
MVNTIEDRNREPYTTKQPVGDRRRPGRRDFENPALIALLRQNRHLDMTASDATREDAVAIGIIVAAIIAVLALGAIVLVGLIT